MTATRQSKRIKSQNIRPDYTGDAFKISLKFHEIYPSGTVLRIKRPQDESQEKYPFGLVQQVQGEKYDEECHGEYWDLFNQGAFRFRHIDHLSLLKSGIVRFKLRAGYVSLYESQFVADDINKFESVLLRQELSRMQGTINALTTRWEYSSESIITKFNKSIHGLLHNKNYMNGKSIPKSIICPLPLFLIHYKYPIESVIYGEWIKTGSKPNRKYIFNFDDDDINKFHDKNITEKTITSNRKNISFKMYKISYEFKEAQVQLMIRFKIKRKIGKGRWTSTGN